MMTRIVFAGGVQVDVQLDVDQVRDALQQEDGAGLSELTENDRDGTPIRIYINRDLVAFIMDSESTERPAEEPPDDESAEDGSHPVARRQQVTDIWGNPIRRRRRPR